jgi:hypothetical protein
MFKSTILGQLIAVNRRSNTPFSKLYAALLQCMEWTMMGYPLKWIRPNLYRAQLDNVRFIYSMLCQFRLWRVHTRQMMEIGGTLPTYAGSQNSPCL